MKTQPIETEKERAFAIAFDEGEEVTQGLLSFAKKNEIRGAHFTAIGAFQKLTLGFFELEKKDYKRINVEEQVEVLTLSGNIALFQGEPKIHAHVVVGKQNGTAHGGHLLSAVVRPTLEVFLVQTPKAFERQFDPRTGLTLFSFPHHDPNA